MAPMIVSRQYFCDFQRAFFQVGYRIDNVLQSLRLGVAIRISARDRRGVNRVAAVSLLLKQDFVPLILINNAAFKHDAPP